MTNKFVWMLGDLEEVEDEVLEHKGGPGSGHHGHSGLSGVHGGSTPGKGGGSSLVSSLIDSHPNVLSDNSNDAYKAANALTWDLKEKSKDLGIYDEVTHWTGAIDPDEWNDFVGVKNWRKKPVHVPDDVQNELFTNNNLRKYYVQEPGKGNSAPVKLFKRALAGEFGNKHKEAASLIQDISQEIFERKYGKSGVLYRGGSPVGMSVSESKSTASRIGKLLSGDSSVYEVNITKDVILFGERIIPSPYPEKEWIIDTSLIETKEFKQLPIDQESKDNLLKIRTGIFFDEINDLTEQMYTGQISLGEYQETFKRLVRELNTSTAAIGKGGWDNMSSRDWGRTGPAIKQQYRHLQGFVEYIDDNRNTVSLKQLQARARLYGYGSKSTAILIEVPISIADLLPWLPKDGSTVCLVGCGCHWQLVVTSISNNLKYVQATWVMNPALENCEDCQQRNGHVETFSVPEHVEVPSQIGGY